MRASSSPGPASAASCSRTRASTCAASPVSATAPDPSSGLSSSAADCAASSSASRWRRRPRSRERSSSSPGCGSTSSNASASARSSASRPCSSAAGLGVGERAARGYERAPGGGHVGAQGRDPVAPRGIQQVELDGRADEPARLVLGDHLDQRLADALEVVARAAAAVEQRTRAALAPDAARDGDALGILGRELGELLGQLGLGERRLDVGLVAARPDERGVRAAAEQQADGLGEDRLAGARLARQHVQARVQRQARGAHEHEVLDDELLEHQRVKASR